MRLFNKKKTHCLLHLISAFALSFFIFRIHDHYIYHQLHFHRVWDYCKVTNVTRSSIHSSIPSILNSSNWDVRVLIPSINTTTRLSFDRYHTDFTTRQLYLFKSLDTCDSISSCKNTTLQCSYGVEDPSDVLLFAAFNDDSAFITMCKICLVGFLFFVASVLIEHSLFSMRANGLFNEKAAFQLTLIGLSSLLYVIIIPQQHQFSVWGSGFIQTIAFCIIIFLIATSLPAAVIICLELVRYFADTLFYTMGFFFFVISWFVTFMFVKFVHTIQSTYEFLKYIYFHNQRDTSISDQFTDRIADINSQFLEHVIDSSFLQQIRKFTLEQALRISVKSVEDHLSDDDEINSVIQSFPGTEYGSFDDEESTIGSERNNIRNEDQPPREDTHLIE